MRRTAAMFAFVLGGCQAFLVFDAAETKVVVINGDAGSAGADAATTADVSEDASPIVDAPPQASFDGGDPCALPDPSTTLVLCDRFDDADASHGWTPSSAGAGTVDVEFDASTRMPGGSLHIVNIEQQTASVSYVFSAIKPTKLRLEFDYSLASFAHGMATAQIRFGTYFVRIVVTDESFLGYDEYNQNNPGADFGQHDGILPAGPAWSHVALEIATNSTTVESAKLWVNGALVADGALIPTDSTTQSLEVSLGGVDGTAADMRFDNLRVTRSP